MATLLDWAGGCAVHTTLPPGKPCTRLDPKVNHLKAVALTQTLLHAEGPV